MSRWDVYRDADGDVVTLTEDQLRAVWHAVRVVNDVRAAEGDRKRLGEHTSFDIDAYKSRLLGRMLMDGRPPLDEKPPLVDGARDYAQVEPDEFHYYLGHGHPFLSQAEQNDRGQGRWPPRPKE